MAPRKDIPTLDSQSYEVWGKDPKTAKLCFYRVPHASQPSQAPPTLTSGSRSFRVAALPRGLHATYFNVVAEGEADEAHHASQVWWNFGGRLRWAQASCDRQDDRKMAELCTQVSCSVYVAI